MLGKTNLKSVYSGMVLTSLLGYYPQYIHACTHPPTHISMVYMYPPIATPYYRTAFQLIERNRVSMKRALLEGKGREVEAVGKLQDFYLSCLNEEVANSLGVDPLIDLITQTG